MTETLILFSQVCAACMLIAGLIRGYLVTSTNFKITAIAERKGMDYRKALNDFGRKYSWIEYAAIISAIWLVVSWLT